MVIAAMAAIAMLLFPAAARTQEKSTHRLQIDERSETITGEWRGLTEIVVVPPFEDARVTLLIDGAQVAVTTLPPYRAEVDFGDTAVEHVIEALISRGRQEIVRWRRVVNEGNKPLTIRLRATGDPISGFEASVTAPKEDPIEFVEFFDGSETLGRTTHPPHRVSIPPDAAPSFIYATAKTRSGVEITDYFSEAGDIQFGATQVRTVQLYVSAVDTRGNAQANLDRSFFRVLDGGREARILEFAKAFNQPVSIALVLDASSSMNVDMEDAVLAARKFAKNTMRDGDRFAVFTVRSSARREQAMTGDSDAVQRALSSITALGNTALYDAISSAIRELKNEKSRRAIVVLSDGADTDSIFSFNEVLDTAKLHSIPIYGIAFGSDPELAREAGRLELLAGQTGGFVTRASSQNLAARYREIEQDLRAQYAIKYQISDESKPNEWRAVRVELKNPDLKARTIRGYFTR